METKIIHQVKGCPVCGSTVTISAMGTKELKDTGKMERDVKTHLEVQVIPLLPSNITGAPVDALIVHKDACADCGTIYATWSEIQKIQPPQVQRQPPQQFLRGR